MTVAVKFRARILSGVTTGRNRKLRYNLRIIPDPRVERGKDHSLHDMLMIAILGMLCWAESLMDFEDFGNAPRCRFSPPNLEALHRPCNSLIRRNRRLVPSPLQVADRNAARYSRGLQWLCSRNFRLKLARLLNPDSRAMSATVLSLSQRRRHAWPRRTSVTN